MHGHLVAVEVGVERGADERVNADRLALHQHRLERLNSEAVQRRRPVQEHRVVLNDLLEDLVDLGALLLDDLLGPLDRLGDALFHQLVDDEGFEQLHRHRLGQPALVQAQLRANHDHGAARIVHALAQEVLAEPSLLALEHVRQRLERPLAAAADRLGPAPVVEQRVHRLLQHPPLVPEDDLRRAVQDQLLQPVVAVDDASVQVVQVAGGEPPAVQRHEGAQVGRDDRNDVQDHPGRVVALLTAVTRMAESVHDLEPLEHLLLAMLAGLRHDPRAELVGHLVHVQPAQQLTHRRRTDVGAEHLVALCASLCTQLDVLLLVDEFQLLDLLLAGLDYHVVRVIDHPLEVAQGEVQQVAHGAGQGLEEPDVRHRHRELDVAHPLAPHLGERDLHAAAVAYDATVADPLVLAAVALPVLDRAEDPLAEQPVLLWLERAVVDGLGLDDLAPRPPVSLPLECQAPALL